METPWEHTSYDEGDNNTPTNNKNRHGPDNKDREDENENSLPAKMYPDEVVTQEQSHYQSLECDFDRNPSILIQHIVGHKWKVAIQLLLEEEEKNNNDSDSDSDSDDDDDEENNAPSSPQRLKDGMDRPQDEMDQMMKKTKKAAKKFSKATRTWAYRKEFNGDIRWRVLPIHAALLHDAPEELIQLIMQQYSEGMTCTDDLGNLPIHLAFTSGYSEEILGRMIEAHPNCLHIQNSKHRTPLECAKYCQRPNRGIVLMAKYAAETATVDVTAAMVEAKLAEKGKLKELHTEIAKNATIHDEEKQKLMEQHKMTVRELNNHVTKFQQEAKRAYDVKSKQCEELIRENKILQREAFVLEKNLFVVERSTVDIQKRALKLRQKAMSRGLLTGEFGNNSEAERVASPREDRDPPHDNLPPHDIAIEHSRSSSLSDM
eukprot:scaffold143857_cov52-Attheya_sp.AAC.5